MDELVKKFLAGETVDYPIDTNVDVKIDTVIVFLTFDQRTIPLIVKAVENIEPASCKKFTNKTRWRNLKLVPNEPLENHQ